MRKLDKLDKTGIVVLAIALPILIIAFSCIWQEATDYTNVIKTNWGIELPSKSAHFHEEYHNTDFGPQGDGTRYYVYSYKDGNPIAEAFSWRSNELPTEFHDSYSAAAEEWLDAIEVPSEKRPNYANCRFYYTTKDDHDELILFWDRTAKRLYILESHI